LNKFELMMIDELRLDKNENVWTKRFIAAAIIQGAIVVALTAFLILSQISILKPEISRVIASGGAGTWFTFGYMMYIVVGVIGVAVSSLFYYYLERVRKVQYNTTFGKALAWMHLVLMNIGTSVAMGLMMIAGYLGGASMLPISVGGRGFNAAQAHEILAPFVEPISVAILVILLGVIAGGLSFLLVYKSKQSDKSSRSSKKEHISYP
jgi:heme/copper-type cytochrome/quinol oxidase subunit 1